MVKVIKWVILILTCICGGIIIGSLKLAYPWDILIPLGAGILMGVINAIIFDWIENRIS